MDFADLMWEAYMRCGLLVNLNSLLMKLNLIILALLAVAFCGLDDVPSNSFRNMSRIKLP